MLEDEDDPIDAKAYILDRPRPKEVSIVGRRWFRKGYGGTYHTAAIFVDGKGVFKTPMEYGYGDQYVETGTQWLEDNNYIPRRQHSASSGGQAAPWRWFEELGIPFEYYAQDVKCSRDL